MNVQTLLFAFLAFHCVFCTQYTPRVELTPKGTIPVFKSVFEGLYYIYVEVGTPPQVYFYNILFPTIYI